MFQWRIQIPVRIKQDPECSVVLNKIISAGTLCPFSTKIMSPTLSSELAIDTCPLLVNLQGVISVNSVKLEPSLLGGGEAINDCGFHTTGNSIAAKNTSL